MLNTDTLLDVYGLRKDKIRERIGEFKEIMNASDERVFAELCFCLCTPQSRAVICWKAVSTLMENGLLYEGSETQIASFLKGVRFREKKAAYIVDARNLFTENGKLRIKESLKASSDVFELREWFLRNVNGLGMKETSHFLRNVGLGLNLAILDRHVLKNLESLHVIKGIPKSLTKRRYEEIEKTMRAFAGEIGIPMAELDLLFWSIETGMVFK